MYLKESSKGSSGFIFNICTMDKSRDNKRKRLAILRGLLRNTPVVIMDEPTAFLDRRTAKKILSNLVEFLKNNGNTVIIATHDPLAVSVCEDIIKLEEIARRAS